MAKSQASPVERAARLLDLVPFISTHQGIALGDLAQEFDISESELLSDLNTLWMCGLPGYTPLELIDLEFESGYVSIRNAEILQKVRLLTKQELVILILGLDILRDSFLTERADIRESIDRLTSRIQAIVGNVATAEPIVNSNFRATITQAIDRRRDLNISYYSTIRDSTSDRFITPIDISIDHGFEVLNAYCHTVEGFRTFRLENMKSVRMADASPKIPSQQSEQRYQWDVSISARHRTSLERFRAFSHDLQAGGASQILAESFSRDWLLRSALSTLASVEVLGPPDARASIAESCRQMLALYNNGDLSS